MLRSSQCKTAGQRGAKREDLEHSANELFDVVKSGKVKISVNQTFALKDVAQVVVAAEERHRRRVAPDLERGPGDVATEIAIGKIGEHLRGPDRRGQVGCQAVHAVQAMV